MGDLSATKNCTKCGLLKPLFDFYPQQRKLDGRENRCKECAKEARKAWRAANLERAREYDRIHDQEPERRAKRSARGRTLAFRELVKRYREKYPERQRAHNAVKRAIKSGAMIRQPCLICGDKAEAHHPDYDAPLDVVWLCKFHHEQTHAIVARAEYKGDTYGTS